LDSVTAIDLDARENGNKNQRSPGSSEWLLRDPPSITFGAVQRFVSNAGSDVATRPVGSRLPYPHRGRCLSSGRDNNRSNLKSQIEYTHVSRLRPRLRRASHSAGWQNGRKRRATIHEAILRPQPEPAISMILYCRQLRRSHHLTNPKPPFPVPTLPIGQMSYHSSCAVAKGQISSRRFPGR
jgi:hypothetical protein